MTFPSRWPSRRLPSSEYRTPPESGPWHAIAKWETIWHDILLWDLFPKLCHVVIMGIISHSCQVVSQPLPKADRSGGEGPAIAAVGRRKTREERRTGQSGESQDTTEEWA